MNAPTTQATIELPITGMTCAACARRLEGRLNQLPGVHAAVNFATERARIRYDAASADMPALLDRIRKTGYDVAGRDVELAVDGMTCAACATRIEKALNRLPGAQRKRQFRNGQGARALHAGNHRRRCHAHGGEQGRLPGAAHRIVGPCGRKSAPPRCVSRGAYAVPLVRRADGAFPRPDGRTCSRAMRTASCPAGCSSPSRRPCSSGSAAASTSAHVTPCAAAARTWMC